MHKSYTVEEFVKKYEERVGELEGLSKFSPEEKEKWCKAVAEIAANLKGPNGLINLEE